MRKKFLLRIILSLVLGIVLEVFIFNYSAMRIRLDPSLNKDQTFTLNDMEMVNWIAGSDGIVSKEDPQLFFTSDGIERIETVDIQFHTNPTVTTAQFFYTDEGGMVKAVDATILKSNYARFKVGAAAQPILRIDLGGSAGIHLNDITVTINSSVLHISISRILMVVLIYICGSLLFRIQKMPDYHLDQKVNTRGVFPSEDRP